MAIPPRTLVVAGVVAAACALLQPHHLLGQVPGRLAPGSRVRVVATPMLPIPTTATVSGWRADSLLLDIAGGSTLAVPLTTLTRLEISRGRKSKVVTGAVVGLLVGTAATAAFLAGYCSDSDTVCESDEVFRAFAILALPSTAIGAAIGLAIRVERWESLALTHPAIGRAALTGLRIRVALGF